MKIGDIVCRKKYGKDICFRITDIKDGIYYLTGIEYRLIADSEESDLELSDFSSDGATSKLTMGPTITAPGSSIKGAILGKADSQGLVPEEESDPDKYGYLNGTSMATPNYCGAVAVLVGEQDFASDAERRAYIKSINMRTMSTAKKRL